MPSGGSSPQISTLCGLHQVKQRVMYYGFHKKGIYINVEMIRMAPDQL